MKRKKPVVILALALAVIAAIAYYFFVTRTRAIILTGIVTTDEVIVSSEIQGRLQQLLVKQGDTVTNGELLGLIQPQEWKADIAYYANTQRQSKAQVTQAEADLKYPGIPNQQPDPSGGSQSRRHRGASHPGRSRPGECPLEFRAAAGFVSKAASNPCKLTIRPGRPSTVSGRADDSLRKQVVAAQAAVGARKIHQHQIAARRAALQGNIDLSAAAGAQKDKARVRLGYTEIHAPTNGIVDVRAALQGEVVNPGQAIVTLINPDDLWVRADVEESYIDRIRLGDKMKVRLPSGAEREGTVFFRGVDADYATQRDVSRTKRDIKTFEIRLRCDNRDRALAVGMTAYVYFCRSANCFKMSDIMFDVEVENLTKSLRRFRRRGRLELHRRPRRGVRPARAQRRGQIHAHPHVDDARAAHFRHGAHQRLRHRPPGQRGAPVHRRHPAGDDLRPGPERRGEHDHFRQALRHPARKAAAHHQANCSRPSISPNGRTSR